MYDLCLILPHLGPGGAQRVAVLAADHYASKGFRVCIVSLLPGKPLTYPPPKSVDFYDLGPRLDAIIRSDFWNRRPTARARRFFLRNIRRLRQWFARLTLWLLWPWLHRAAEPGSNTLSDHVLCSAVSAISGPQARLLKELLDELLPVRVLSLLTRTNTLTCLALWNSSNRLVVSERNDPSLQSISPLWRRLRDLLYQRADVVTANTNGVLHAFESLPGIHNVALLPNPVPAESLRAGMDGLVAPQKSVGFICLARLVHQKGIDVLLHAMADSALTACAWSLQIVGDGPERSMLEELSFELGIANRVAFVGFQANPRTFLSASSVFVLPSRFEGMPNALLEAMSIGLAVIVTDSSPGPLEVVEPCVSGLVVPSEDPAALAEAMAKLALDGNLRCRMGAAARERIEALDWPRLEPSWNSILDLP